MKVLLFDSDKQMAPCQEGLSPSLAVVGIVSIHSDNLHCQVKCVSEIFH